MKLDRNVNEDKSGKYALLKLRAVQNALSTEARAEVLLAINTLKKHKLLHFGGDVGEEGEMFFVMKYKDKFAAPALKAYSEAIGEEIMRLIPLVAEHSLDIQNKVMSREKAVEAVKQFRSLLQYQHDIFQEYLIAQAAGVRIPD